MTREELIGKCRYYGGEDANPFEDKDQNKGMLWFYEMSWVEDTLNGMDFAEQLGGYSANGLDQLAASDGVPMTLKARLFNRYGRDSYSMLEAAASFRKFYRKYYGRRSEAI